MTRSSRGSSPPTPLSTGLPILRAGTATAMSAITRSPIPTQAGYLGVPNGGADGPPGVSPDPEFGNPTFCARIGGAAVCLGGGTGVGWRNDRPFARDLTWEQAFGIFHRRQRARAGTENYMPHLGSAQTLEDFGTSIDPAETLNSGLTWFGENLTPVRLFICAFDAASCTGEEAAEAAAQAAMTVFWPVRTGATLIGAARGATTVIGKFSTLDRIPARGRALAAWSLPNWGRAAKRIGSKTQVSLRQEMSRRSAGSRRERGSSLGR